MRSLYFPVLVLCALACRSSTEAGTVGIADVAGLVKQRSGAPFGQSQLTITCADVGISTTVPIDSTGRYATQLTLSAEKMRATGGEVLCIFAAPDPSSTRFRRSLKVPFSAPGLHPFLLIDLSESP